MKKILFVLAAAAFTASCDKVTEQEYKGGKGGVIIDDTTTTDTTAAVRRVLIEDFTGQTCGNCPAASDIAANIKSANPNRVVVIEVHAGFFAEPAPGGTKYRTDFRCIESTELDNFFGVSAAGNPNGMVDRMDFPTNQQIKGKDTWSSLATSKLALPPVAKIKMETTYSPGSRAVTLKTTTRFVTDYPDNTSLVVYVTEDSLLGWQKDYRLPSGSQDVENFVHRHVLRASLNSTFGQALTTEPVATNKGVVNQFNYTLPANFVDKHCALVAILYNTTTREILQVEEHEIVE